MTPTELIKIVERLRKQGRDDADYEAKACSKGLSSDVWESVSAFGNTKGGTLLLGIEEKSGFRLTNSFLIDKVLDQFIEGIGDGGKQGKKVENPPRYSAQRVDFEEGQILVIEISEVEDRRKPCFMSSRGLNRGAFKRVDDRDIPLSATEVYELQNLLNISSADKKAVQGASIKDINDSLAGSLIASEVEKNSRVVRGIQSQEEAYRRLNITTNEDEVSLAGLLCLGVYPQQFFPKLVVDVAVHPGITKSEPGGPRFLDRVICEGTISEMVDEALIAVTKNLRTFSYVEGAGRRDELEIPREVLREAIANSVIHREYAPEFVGQAVSVDIYSDRVEITNPGGLWGGKTIETLSNGESRCRNSSLIKLASRIQTPKEGAPVEGQGSGIRLMYNEMRAHALGDPRFVANIDSFKVVLQRGGAELKRNREWLDRVSTRETDSKEQAVLLALRQPKCSTVHELHKSLGYDSDEIRAIAGRLSDEGLITEGPRDTFTIADLETLTTKPKPKTRDVILGILADAPEPLSAREISYATGIQLPTLRAQMNKLVREGLVNPTAPPTNRNRKYYLV